jgi:hypothetical protein
MARALHRYEILLPLRFNDDRAVPGELLARTRMEIEERFGSLSVETQVIRGFDRESGAQDDRLVRLFVDAPDSAENLAFFLECKERLAARFEQEEIWITRYPVEAL